MSFDKMMSETWRVVPTKGLSCQEVSALAGAWNCRVRHGDGGGLGVAMEASVVETRSPTPSYEEHHQRRDWHLCCGITTIRRIFVHRVAGSVVEKENL